MTVTDFILIAVVLAIMGGAIAYIIKEKKSGVKCIGCPSGKTCKAYKSKNEKDCCCNCK